MENILFGVTLLQNSPRKWVGPLSAGSALEFLESRLPLRSSIVALTHPHTIYWGFKIDTLQLSLYYEKYLLGNLYCQLRIWSAVSASNANIRCV